MLLPNASNHFRYWNTTFQSNLQRSDCLRCFSKWGNSCQWAWHRPVGIVEINLRHGHRLRGLVWHEMQHGNVVRGLLHVWIYSTAACNGWHILCHTICLRHRALPKHVALHLSDFQGRQLVSSNHTRGSKFLSFDITTTMFPTGFILNQPCLCGALLF